MQPRKSGNKMLPTGLQRRCRNGRDYWMVQATVNGGRVSKTIGYASREKALREYPGVLERLLSGSAPLPSPTGMGLGEFMERYFLPSRMDDGLLEKTIACDRDNAGHLIAYFGRTREISTITTRDVEDFKGWRRQHGGWTDRNSEGEVVRKRSIRPRARTINLDLRTLRMAMVYAHRLGFITEVPGIKNLAESGDRRARKFHSREEMAKVLAAAGRHRLLLTMAYHTGMRSGEILSRIWDDLDLTRGQIVVCDRPPAFRCKTRSERVIPMTRVLRAEFAAVPKDERYGRVFTVKSLRWPLIRSCTAAEVPVIHPHATRHTFASLAAMDGMERGALRAILGHCDSKMLDEIYQHVMPEHVEQQMARLSFGSGRGIGEVISMRRGA